MQHLAAYITDFADAAVLIPLCAAVAVTLLLLRRHRMAFVWFAVIAGVWAVMLALKVAGYACEALAPGLPLVQLGLVTPSGHVAAAAAAYGGVVALTSGSLRRACLVAFGIAVLIGITRVVSGDHSVSEVIVGGVVGVSGAYALASWLHGPVSRSSGAALIGIAAVVLITFHGMRFTWEPTIRSTSTEAARDLLAYQSR